MKPVVPIFFSVNDAYSPFLATAIASIKDNASPRYTYRIHILTDDISDANRSRLLALATEDFQLEFFALSSRLRELSGVKALEKHCFGAFASLTIYFRLFIPVLFPQYDKAIYLDADLVVPGDISRLWEELLGGKLVGAVADYSIQKIAPFMRYIDRYVGVDHRNYVNSGVLLLNCRRLREEDLCGRFLHWAQTYALQTVAPDQDYLNALCWDVIHYLDPNWNAMPSECLPNLENPQIIHFNLASKPWLNEHTPYEEIFWKYAAQSGFEADIRARQEQFLKDTKAVRSYKGAIKKLIAMAARLTGSEQSFRSLIDTRMELRLCS
ncbi:MAG: glycosyltransferase family 8 protein [Bacteroidales bacterium]|nr:glycosyltransferase family 8 protein [Bacteroidales bacterium]